MSDLTKKLRDTERALKLEHETVQRVSRQRDAMAAEVERLSEKWISREGDYTRVADELDIVKRERDQLKSMVVPNEYSANRYGLDCAYFRSVINRELNRPLVDYKPDELARVLLRMAATADESVLCEPEFLRRMDLSAHNADVIERFKDELVKSVSALYRPHIEGVCAVVQQQLRQQIKESAK